MILKIIAVLIGAVVSAILYRLGGEKGFNKLIRRLGVPAIALIVWWLLDSFKISAWWAYLLFFGGVYAGLTSYWDNIFGYDNFYAHGLGIGLASFFLIFAGAHWWACVAYTVVLSVFMGVWSRIFNDVWFEECGRGAIVCGALPLLLI